MQRRRRLFLLIPLLASACVGLRHHQSETCSPPPPSAGDIPALDLAGDFELTFVATLGEHRGSRESGVLILKPRDSVRLHPVRLDGSPDPSRIEPYWGSARIRLDRVGAYVEGTVTSEKADAPGVLVTAVPSRRTISLSLGSARNQPAVLVLDGRYVAAPITEVTPGGFRGTWDATIGTIDYHAAGYYCAVRRH